MYNYYFHYAVTPKRGGGVGNQKCSNSNPSRGWGTNYNAYLHTVLVQWSPRWEGWGPNTNNIVYFYPTMAPKQGGVVNQNIL